MGKFIDLTGQKFGRLTVIERVENNKWGGAQWLCNCSCKKQIITTGDRLIRVVTKSCGCLRKELTIQRNYKHGHSCVSKKSRIYEIWQSMIQRCNNPNYKFYKNYGGRGIKVCEKWLKFEGFLQDMGEQPEGLTLDRVDNNGDYYKENCRWTTQKEQMKNTRRAISITISQITKFLVEWCEELGLSYNTVYCRLWRGWTPEEALEIVPRKKKK